MPLTGDWVQVAGFNANGIASSPSGDVLLVVNSTTGTLFRVDPATGAATAVQTSADLTAGDGILLRGRELAVVRNQFNEIAILRMSPDLGSATLVRTLRDPDFAVPTTAVWSPGEGSGRECRHGGRSRERARSRSPVCSPNVNGEILGQAGSPS